MNAHKITRVFYDWHETFGGRYELSQAMSNRLNEIYRLNSAWNLALDGFDNIFLLSDSDWLEWLEKIEGTTRMYLQENNINTIDDLWITRTEIK